MSAATPTNFQKEQMPTVQNIVDRAVRTYSENGAIVDGLDIWMDLAATHNHGCALNLDALLDFDDFSFMHDITGINRHLNRDTLKLEGCFIPRCAAIANP